MAKNLKPLPPLSDDEREAVKAIKSSVTEKRLAIAELEARKREIEAELDAAHYAVSASVAGHIAACRHDGALKVASLAYWTFDDSDVRRGIASALNIGTGAVIWQLYEVQLSGPCSQCGDKCSFVALSWSQVNSHVHRCDACTAKKEAEEAARDAELDAQIAARDNELRRLRTMPYAEYLKTDHWQEVRKAAIKRAKYRCQTCNANKPLQVHHRTYERRGQEYSTDVIALCADCHKTFHENGKIAQRGE